MAYRQYHILEGYEPTGEDDIYICMEPGTNNVWGHHVRDSLATIRSWWSRTPVRNNARTGETNKPMIGVDDYGYGKVVIADDEYVSLLGKTWEEINR